MGRALWVRRLILAQRLRLCESNLSQFTHRVILMVAHLVLDQTKHLEELHIGTEFFLLTEVKVGPRVSLCFLEVRSHLPQHNLTKELHGNLLPLCFNFTFGHLMSYLDVAVEWSANSSSSHELLTREILRLNGDRLGLMPLSHHLVRWLRIARRYLSLALKESDLGPSKNLTIKLSLPSPCSFSRLTHKSRGLTLCSQFPRVFKPWLDLLRLQLILCGSHHVYGVDQARLHWNGSHCVRIY